METKLNLACGNDYKEGYINIDDQSMYQCKVDKRADITTMKWKSGTVDEILLSHFMMYVTDIEAPVFFTKIYSWLKLSGRFIIENIDLDKVLSIALNEPDQEKRRNWGLINLFGTPITSPHRWGWTLERVKYALEQAGFRQFEAVPALKKPDRDFRIIATK